MKSADLILAQIDAKSSALKEKILNSVTDVKVLGTSYFVSADGDDANDGLTPETALVTLDGLSKVKLNPGDGVFLRRGDMWRIVNFRVPGGITVSAYGEGAKPILSCSPMNGADPVLWSLLDGTDNVWVFAHELADCGTLDFGGGVFAYKEIPSYVDGRFVLRSDNAVAFDVTKHLSCDLAFFQNCDKVKTDAGMPKMTLDNTGKLYLRCDKGNPGKVFDSIEFHCQRNALSMSGHTITIDNLCIRHCGAHGVGAGNIMELTVQNCEIGPLGGAIQFYNPSGSVTRYGNGVEIYGACYDYTVKNCYIHDIYDAGVTHQRKGGFSNVNLSMKSAYARPGHAVKTFETDGVLIMEKVRYIENLFERCIYSIEYFCEQGDGEDDIMRDILMEGNICRYAGGWGWQRPDKVARHIQGGWLNVKRKYHAEDYTIRSCIFDRSIDVILSISSTRECDLPKMEGNVYIQYGDGKMGMYGVPYDRYIPFVGEGEELLHKIDPRAQVYAAKRE